MSNSVVKGQLLCGVCKKSSDLICTGCYTLSYCCPEHQKKDWNTHKIACRPYPVKVAQDPDDGLKCLVATKTIQPGETILKETSIISGPFLNMFELTADPPRDHIKISCLSCYKELPPENLYLCSRCKWPVCDSRCGKKFIHAEMECKLFAEKGLKPLPLEEEVRQKRDIYYLILALRILLLKNSDPLKWHHILGLKCSTNEEQMAKGLSKYVSVDLAMKFIRDECGLKGFDEKILLRVLDIIRQNILGNDMTNGRYQEVCVWLRTGVFIFPQIPHMKRCGIPAKSNANCVITQLSSKKYEFEAEIRALQQIQPGESIRQLYVLSADYENRTMAHYAPNEIELQRVYQQYLGLIQENLDRLTFTPSERENVENLPEEEKENVPISREKVEVSLKGAGTKKKRK